MLYCSSPPSDVVACPKLNGVRALSCRRMEWENAEIMSLKEIKIKME